jgi:Thoeris protein ThsA, Macro domain
MQKKIILTEKLIPSVLAGVGACWTLVESYCMITNKTPNINYWVFIFLAIIFGLIWFVINGYFISDYLRNSIQITSNALTSEINILFGDIFTQKGLTAISVNEYFDSTVDDRHVAKRSLHGIMLTKCWAGNITHWDSQIVTSLSSITPIPHNNNRPPPAKNIKYEIGTTAIVRTPENNKPFLCVALSETDANLTASADSFMLNKALRELLTKARIECADKPLNIPLMGNGLAKTGIKPNIIIDLILLAIFEESKNGRITGQINIVLHKSMKSKINLSTIKQDWM